MEKYEDHEDYEDDEDAGHIPRDVYDDIILALKDAIAYMKGDKSRGRVVRFDDDGNIINESAPKSKPKRSRGKGSGCAA